jgi:hypothetical protein
MSDPQHLLLLQMVKEFGHGMIVGWTWTEGLGIMIFKIPNHLQVKYKYNNLNNESFMSPIVTPYVKH